MDWFSGGFFFQNSSVTLAPIYPILAINANYHQKGVFTGSLHVCFFRGGIRICDRSAFTLRWKRSRWQPPTTPPGPQKKPYNSSTSANSSFSLLQQLTKGSFWFFLWVNMATFDDKLLGEKLHYYCSSSEDEDDGPKVECQLFNFSSLVSNFSKKQCQKLHSEILSRSKWSWERPRESTLGIWPQKFTIGKFQVYISFWHICPLKLNNFSTVD